MLEEAPGMSRRMDAAELSEIGQLRVHSERIGVVHTVSIVGELDLANVDQLEHELLRVEATDALTIILDLSGLTFVDSTGLRAILRAHARSRADSNRLALLRGPTSVQRLFEICGVSELLPFVD
jgi:anti-sigma B factor antagonist